MGNGYMKDGQSCVEVHMLYAYKDFCRKWRRGGVGRLVSEEAVSVRSTACSLE